MRLDTDEVVFLALLEEHPELKSAELVARVQAVRAGLLTADLDGSASNSGEQR